MLNVHPTLLLTAWVKNVYSLCVEGVINSANLSTTTHRLPSTNYRLRVQTASFTQTLDSFTPSLYTPKNSYLPDTTHQLYTLSTVPTIKKTKENKKGI